jgi:hypothetical protein
VLQAVAQALVGRMRERCMLCSLLIHKCLFKEARLGKNHYSQGKRMREIAKKQKQEQKKERKLARQSPPPEENVDVPAPAIEE